MGIDILVDMVPDMLTGKVIALVEESMLLCDFNLAADLAKVLADSARGTSENSEFITAEG